MDKIEEVLALQRELKSKTDRLAEIVDAASGRDLSRRERAEVDQIRRDVDALKARIPTFDPRHASAHHSFTRGDREVDKSASDGLKLEERVADWQRDRGLVPARGFDQDRGRLSLGRMIRGAATGIWDGADAERRALSENALAGGGYLLSPELSGMVIDRVRNQMRVMQAGATTVPLTTQQTYVPRLSGGVSPTWKTEGNAIADMSMTFERVTFTPATLPVLVKISAELFEDLSPEATDVIEGEITQALSLELDRACLRGSGVAPEVTGVRNQSGVVITTLGTGNGGLVNGYDTLTNAISVVRTNNIEPTAVIWTPRTQQAHDLYKDSTGQPLRPPPSIADIPRLATNQIPTNLTVGSSSTCTEIYVGRWSDLMVGIRTDLRFDVRVLNERFIDNLQYGLLCYIRADVQLRHPLSFNVITGCTS
jgi:HK97 family phage major capsid protein